MISMISFQDPPILIYSSFFVMVPKSANPSGFFVHQPDFGIFRPRMHLHSRDRVSDVSERMYDGFVCLWTLETVAEAWDSTDSSLYRTVVEGWSHSRPRLIYRLETGMPGSALHSNCIWSFFNTWRILRSMLACDTFAPLRRRWMSWGNRCHHSCMSLHPAELQ